MSVEAMIGEGVYLMFIGMGFVVVFLSILVLILNLMEKLIDHELPVEQLSSPTVSGNTLTAVISAAVHQHRERSRK